MLTITAATKKKIYTDFISALLSPKKEVQFIISSDMFCRNRTLNNRGFSWIIAPAVVVAVGTYMDGFQRIKGIVIRMNRVFLGTILHNLLIQVLHE